MTDIEIVRDAIEIFAVQYFDTIEMSGTVKAKRQESINYLSIDLTSTKWDENLDKLHQSLFKYLQDWGKKNFPNFQDYVAISRLTIEYLLPEKDVTLTEYGIVVRRQRFFQNPFLSFIIFDRLLKTSIVFIQKPKL